MFLFRNLFILFKSIGKNVRVSLLANILPGSVFEGHNFIGRFTTFKGYIGKFSYIGNNSIIMCKIGRYTSIAGGCKIINGRHPIKAPYVSTSPIFYSNNSVLGIGFSNHSVFDEYVYAEDKYPVAIGNDCWIGANVMIVDGVKISDGAVVLAGAVVTKNVPEYAIIAGVPAKIIGFRYSDDQIKKLLKIQWWNKSEQWINAHSLEFLNMESFIENNSI